MKKSKGVKKSMNIAIVVFVIIIAGFIFYNAVYRYPARFRNPADKSLSDLETEALADEILSSTEAQILVAYFSYSGTTKQIAESISEKTGGELFAIEPTKEYSNVYTQSNSEIRFDRRPEIKNKVSDIEKYDVIFIGYPVWWHATPAIINTFLESYDLTDKLIIPFCTSGGSDIDETMPTFLESCENLAVYGEKRIGGTDEVDQWLSELGFGEKSNSSISETDAAVENTSKIENQTIENTTEDITDAAATETQEIEAADNSGKILVAYFTWSGNTTEMAELISEQTGGDLLEIEPAVPYSTVYSEVGAAARIERDENARPEIANLPENLDEYDTIFIGYPIWWHTAPMIIGTFLENYDLTGIDVYPFTQSASMDEEQFENSMEFVRTSAGNGTVHDGLFVRATDTVSIIDYLEENGFV